MTSRQMRKCMTKKQRRAWGRAVRTGLLARMVRSLAERGIRHESRMSFVVAAAAPGGLK